MKNFLKFLFVGVLALGGLQIQTAQGSLPVPKPGSTDSKGQPYTISGLLKLINMDNPAGTSTFLVAKNANGFVSNSNPAGKDKAMVTESQSTDKAGLSNLIKTAANPPALTGAGKPTKAALTLYQDLALIEAMAANNYFETPAIKDQYAKILLYFTLEDPKTKNVYRFYLNDPHPAPVFTRGNSKLSGATTIIAKWNLNKTY